MLVDITAYNTSTNTEALSPFGSTWDVIVAPPGDLAKLYVIRDINKGPWLAGDFLHQKNEALQAFQTLVADHDPRFSSHSSIVVHIHGTA